MKLYEISQGVVGHEIFEALNRKEDFDLAIRRDNGSEKCLPLEVAYSGPDAQWTVAVNRASTGNAGSVLYASPDMLRVLAFIKGVAAGISWGRSDYYRVARHSERKA